MRLSLSCAAAAALIGSSLLGGCAAKETFPASPVPAPLSDLQAMTLADDYLTRKQAAERRYVASVEPTGDGNLVSFRTTFDAAGEPPVKSRMVMVKHDGSAREITFRRSN